MILELRNRTFLPVPNFHGNATNFKGNGVKFAGLAHTGQAGNAFKIVRRFIKFYAHWADAVAGLAFGAVIFIQPEPDHLEAVEERIEGAQRTGGATKRAACQYAPNDEQKHYCQLVIKKDADTGAQVRLQGQHRQARFECSGWTDIFAKPELPKTVLVDSQ